MKKTVWVLAAALMAATASAAIDPQAPIQASVSAEKTVQFGTFTDPANGVIGEQTEFSRLKGPDLCWKVSGLVSGQTYLGVETFVAPDGARFTDGAYQAKTLEDGVRHEIGFAFSANRNGEVNRCWKFDSSDPLGQYKLTLRVGETVFSPFDFVVTP